MYIRSFHTASRLLSNGTVRATLFSKSKCGLCDNASNVMEKVLKKRPQVDYSVVKIDDPKNHEWWEKYCFDVPVLHLETPVREGSLIKVFHRLEEEDVLDKIKGLE
ncbi:hypothetical protein ZYGR_0AD04520 [Zygosaccharomyces rouxii]|uniref:Glutaredoxin-like protein n=2 Tax=Zygosaccharomyces rouxii TaxID=4956 RepID=C5E0Y4_ZYGRC|nr:uncharacterized protein ZYRO0G16566g [Zygosaccharomyces rouxii]KAH9202761.1 hypothetical protein LQ764DRAFT_53756 [Zygosaccharomyces rouxii]GAV51269.1 hypothetical protein ZYGR_0AD04520 [Zygosaccharomyces rouxii]CAR29768.1 ZYRO0G16566p [Zygosaccharomyces rouxii]